MYRFLAFLSIFCIAKLITAEYPSNWERCHAGDTVCLARVIQLYYHTLKDGNKDLNIVPIDPLFIKKLHIVQDSESLVNMNLRLQDVNLYGLSNVIIKRVVGLGKDPSKSKFEYYGSVDKLKLVGKFSVRGNVIIVPVVGRGQMNITLTNVDFGIKFFPKVEIKEGKQYLQFSNVKFDFKSKGFHIEYKNFKNINRLAETFVNENSSVVFDELRPALGRALAEVFGKVASPIFAKFPYKDLFL